MKIQLLLFCYLFFGLNTPSPADWTRKILLGYNNDQFSFLEYKQSRTGTYFMYIDSIFVVSKNTADPYDCNRELMRVIVHEDTTSMGNWIHEEGHMVPFDLNEYMRNMELTPAFPTTRPSIGTLKFEDYGLLLSFKGIARLLLSKENMAKQVPEMVEMMKYEKPRIIAKHDSNKYLFLTIQIGYEAGDSDFKQFILLVPMNELYDAEKTFRELGR